MNAAGDSVEQRKISPVISKIISMQISFTMSESEIAQYVIRQPEKVINSTITAVAKHTGTSEASINRFCKKIGYKGFNGFKIALAQETRMRRPGTKVRSPRSCTTM